MASPVREVEFGTALKISLDNYYDLLKIYSGGLGANEFLQLKLVADSVDINPKTVGERGYRWWSYYNILRRSDLAIEPSPVSGQVMTGAELLSSVYGDFLTTLRTYATIRDLTPNEQLEVFEKTKEIESLQSEAEELALLDRQKWERYANAMGIPVGNRTQYLAWSNAYGKYREIQIRLNRIKQVEALRKRILDRTYSDPDDRKIIEAEFEFNNPFQRLRYPIFPDYEYDDGANFSATYLSSLPIGSSAIFDDRRATTYDKSLETLKTGTGGAFTAQFDRNTQKSTSITTDWGGGASVSYGFINVRASANEFTSIQEDFRKGTKIELGASSVYKANIIYPRWFDATLFDHRHVRNNPHDFERYLGKQGSLRYYPTAAILVRGFSVSFTSSQSWQYDYERKFSASAGGGFNAFGISFGGSGSYTKHETVHEVDRTTTKLTIADGPDTIRFVGLAVKENTVFPKAIDDGVTKALGKGF